MISQIETFEIKGQWWRPVGSDFLENLPRLENGSGTFDLPRDFAILQSERDRTGGTSYEEACRGPLTFDPESGLRLSLLGASEAAFSRDEEEFTILGETSKGRPCTLLDCLVVDSNRQLSGRGMTEHEILVGTLVVGEHVERIDDFRFDKLELRLANLVDFLWGAGPSTSTMGSVLGRSGDLPETARISLEGASVELSIGSKQSNSTHSSRWERDGLISIRSEQKLSWDEWKQKWIQPMSRLITLATGRPSTVETTTAIIPEPESPDEGVDQSKRRNSAWEIVERQSIFSHNKEFRPHLLWFSYASLGTQFERVVQEWLNIHEKLQGTADFLFGALEPGQTLEPQLVTLASVAESYHRAFLDEDLVPADEHQQIVDSMCSTIEDPKRLELYRSRLKHANEPTQKDRIKQVFERSSEAIEPLGRKHGRLAEVIGHTRNYFVHLGDKDEQVLDLREIWEVNTLFEIAIKTNILLDMGLTPADIGSGASTAFEGNVAWMNLQARDCAWPKRRPSSATKGS